MNVIEESSENHCKYVGSRGIMKSCTVYSRAPRSSIRVINGYDDHFEQDLVDGDILYICNAAIPEFRKLLFGISAKIVLVSGDCDVCCWQDMFSSKNEFLMFIENPKIIHWFAQNCICIDHPKLSQMPIGLDYHTMSERTMAWGPRTTPVEQEAQLEGIVSTWSKPWSQRKYKTVAYSNFHFAMNTRFAMDRRNAIVQLPKDCVYYEPEHILRKDTWQKQTDFVFVASPHGGGLDCHRTWEALVLGCIPIVRTSPLDPLFEGLPVWIVREWNEVTAENMRRVIADFETRTFHREKLRLDYWMGKIREKTGNMK